MQNVQEFDWHEHRDVQFFDFSNDVDNGYEVTMQDQGFILKSHCDGREFFMGTTPNTNDCDSTGDGLKSGTNSDGVEPMYDPGTIGSDLKHFGDAVSEEKLDENKAKRSVKNLMKKS